MTANVLILGLVWLVLLGAWLALTLLALNFLRQQRLPDATQALWVLVVLLVPILGPLALWFVRPSRVQS